MSKIYVNFEIKTDEAIRLEVRNGGNVAEKEIFDVDGRFFFFYHMNRSKKAQTFSLREINKEEYLMRKKELLSQRPDNQSRNWIVGDNLYALKIFHNGRWKRNMVISDCIFLTKDNPLKELCDSVSAQVTSVQEKEVALDKQAKTEYAKKCGYFSNKLGINYTNVLRIGPDREKLLQFRKSYNEAVLNVAIMPLKEQRRIYVELNANRLARRGIMEELKILFFEADPKLMDLSELVETLEKNLAKYAEESFNEAIKVASEMDYDERKKLLEKLLSNARELKRQALRELGVDVDAIDFRRYPIFQLRNEVAATLGIDLN